VNICSNGMSGSSVKKEKQKKGNEKECEEELIVGKK
jgi:hypothetical protein